MRMFETLKTYIAQLTDEPARNNGWPFFTGTFSSTRTR
jgi:hypothetical protein